jgi:hypothetical protein
MLANVTLPPMSIGKVKGSAPSGHLVIITVFLKLPQDTKQPCSTPAATSAAVWGYECDYDAAETMLEQLSILINQ